MTIAPARVVAIVVMVAASGAAGRTVAGTGHQLSVLGSYRNGDYGTGVDSATQVLELRYVAGDELQFRIDVPVVRAETSAGFIRFAGGVSPDRRGRHAAGGGGSGPGGGPMVLPVGTAQTVEETDWSTGIGDVEIAVGKRLYGGGVKLLRLDGSLAVKAPTADEDSYLGTGEWDGRLGLAAEYRYWSATAFGGLGWTAYGEPDGYELENGADAYAGVETDPLLGDRVLLSGWVEGREEVVAGAGERIALGLGVRTTGRRAWRFTLRAGLSSAAEDYSVTAGYSWGVRAGSAAIAGAER
jgi:hypothetical protein